MALSRLRQPVIARASSLFRARRRLSSVSSSSSTSLSRTNSGQNSLVDVNGTLLRCKLESGISHLQDGEFCSLPYDLTVYRRDNPSKRRYREPIMNVQMMQRINSVISKRDNVD